MFHLTTALSYWINKFPFHFVLDPTLMEAIKSFSSFIITRGNTAQLSCLDISNMYVCSYYVILFYNKMIYSNIICQIEFSP